MRDTLTEQVRDNGISSLSDALAKDRREAARQEEEDKREPLVLDAQRCSSEAAWPTALLLIQPTIATTELTIDS